MSNVDILKNMGRIVPSAQRSYDSLMNNANIPEWQREEKVGKMLDMKVPVNAPSGMAYMAGQGMNDAQKINDTKQAALKEESASSPFSPFSQEKQGQSFGQRIVNAIPKKGSVLDTILDYGGAPSRVAVGLGVKGVGALTGMDVSNVPEVSEMPQNIEKSGDTARVALPVAVGIGTAGAGTALMAGASFAAGATGQLTEDLTDYATGSQTKSAAGIVGSAVGAGAIDSTLDLLTFGAFKLAKAGLARKSFDTIVSNGIEKGIKPQYRGAMRSSPVALQEYKKQAGDAVADIIGRKQTFEYIDDAGDLVSKGHVPTNLSEFAQAIDQSKKQIYEQYSALSSKATQAGAKIDLSSISDKLLAYSEDPVKQLADKSKASYARDMAVRLMKKGTLDPKQTETLIAELNQGLSKAFSDKSIKGISEVDGSIAAALRESLDDVVMKATGEQYQPLKNAYGSLKTIEKDVGHRALIAARKNVKGLPDLTDIFTGGDIVGGMLTGNPAMVTKGMVGKGISMYYRFLNSPDANIMRMFSGAEKALNNLPVGAADDVVKAAALGTPTQPVQQGLQRSSTQVDQVGKTSQSIVPDSSPKVNPLESPRKGATKGLTAEEFANLTPEEKATGYVGGSDSVPSKMYYHGSPVLDLDKRGFSPTESLRQGAMGIENKVKSPATFFSDKYDTAKFFGENRAQFQNKAQHAVYESGLDMKKTLDLSKGIKSQTTIDTFKDAGVDLYDYFGFKNNDLVQPKIPSNLNASASDLWTFFDDNSFVSKLREQGFDSAILKEEKGLGTSIAVLDNKIIKSVNKAPLPSVGGGLEPLVKEARKFKSASDFVECVVAFAFEFKLA